MQLSTRAAASPIQAPALVIGLVFAFAISSAAVAQVPNETPIQGFIGISATHAFQFSDLPVGVGGGSDDLNDGNGADFRLGFQVGDRFAFDIGYEWQIESDFESHFIPFGMRVYAPPLLDRLHFYGQGAMGAFFTRLHGDFNQAGNSNERGWAWRLGIGAEIDIIEHISAVTDVMYTRGFGSAEDYEYTTVGIGVLYRWDI